MLLNHQKVINKCLEYGVKKIFFSGLVFTTKILFSTLARTHNSLVKLSVVYGFEYIDNICGSCCYKDGLYLLKKDKFI